jgi:hypothetical protein
MFGILMSKFSQFKAAKAITTVPAITARVANEGTGKLKPLLLLFSRRLYREPEVRCASV